MWEYRAPEYISALLITVSNCGLETVFTDLFYYLENVILALLWLMIDLHAKAWGLLVVA